VTWEEWLRKAAQPPSDNEEAKGAKTQTEIKAALAAYQPLKGKEYSVYVKGSYANNTNVRLDYDVDIAVEYRAYFLYDMEFGAEGKTLEDMGAFPLSDPYSREEFKADILAALIAAYGSEALSVGDIAYRVREKKTTLPADVVPSWWYRRYDGLGFDGRPIYYDGSRVFPRRGGEKTNYPKIQLMNGNAKNARTGRRYKRMVRALKKLQTHLVQAGKLEKELASYLIECLVYNVPDEYFGRPGYLGDMQNVLAVIYKATSAGGNASEWGHVHNLNYLFGGGQGWTQAEANRLVTVAWDELGLG
jgi:hypothetical protein